MLVDSFLRGSCVKRERHGKKHSRAPNGRHARIEKLKELRPNASPTHPSCKPWHVPTQATCTPLPPPSPTRTPTSAAAFTGAASKPLASRRDRRSPFGVFGALHGGLQEIPSRSVGDLTEVLDIFGRSTRCLWKHTSKSCARVS